jgi:hypothetical protein
VHLVTPQSLHQTHSLDFLSSPLEHRRRSGVGKTHSSFGAEDHRAIAHALQDCARHGGLRFERLEPRPQLTTHLGQGQENLSQVSPFHGQFLGFPIPCLYLPNTLDQTPGGSQLSAPEPDSQRPS